MYCDQCEMVAIQGVPCHETGCLAARKDYARECKWCGQDFRPEDRYQVLCSQDCANGYNGVAEMAEDYE